MLKSICVLLLLPALAMAGQDAAPGRLVARLPIHVLAVVRPPVVDPATQCETAVLSAELAGRLPPRLLQAISVTESGRTDPVRGTSRAWPWTINAEGEGQFLETRQAAIAAVKSLLARGVQSIDVGCLQVNLKYHPRAFASLEEAFDPRANALYAAHFLNALYADGKDWTRAIAAYHSETPALGDAYRVLVLARWQKPDLRDTPSLASAYRDFAPNQRIYGAFAPAARVYGAFAPGR
jgi:hypothetical protein